MIDALAVTNKTAVLTCGPGFMFVSANWLVKPDVGEYE
jgi:hypothetical protein